MYRDDLEALTARHTALEDELADKTRERDDTARLVEEVKARRRLPILDNIHIASPCSYKWSAMVGDDRTRHCAGCNKSVFNLSAMTRDEAEALIIETASELCAGYFQRADGTILLADCTVGRRRKTVRRSIVAGAFAVIAGSGALAAHVLTGGVSEEPLDRLDLVDEAESIDQGPDTALGHDPFHLDLNRIDASMMLGQITVRGDDPTIHRLDALKALVELDNK